jgi:hypothetical protein
VAVKKGKLKKGLDVVALNAERMVTLSTSRGSHTSVRKSEWITRWEEYCVAADIPFMMTGLSPEEMVIQLGCFGVAVRKGTWNNRGGGVKVENVLSHWEAVAALFTTNHLRDPRMGGVGGEGVKGLGKMARQLEELRATWKKEDPGTVHKVPIPVSVVLECHKIGSEIGIEERGRDLVELGFTWLLRPGEYSKSTSLDERKGKPSKVLLLRDFRFYGRGRQVPLLFDGRRVSEGGVALEREALAQALETTLSRGGISHCEITFEDQKNGIKGEVVSTLINTKFRGKGASVCGVRAAIRIVASMIREGGYRETAVNEGRTGGKKWKITDTDISALVRLSGGRIGEARLGFDPESITPHGLRAGGATAMFVAGATELEIEVRGRWAPGSTAMRSYISALTRSNMPTFFEDLEKIMDNGNNRKGRGERG